MSTRLLVPFGVGVVVVLAAIAGVFYVQRGAHIELKGQILKVRTQAMDAASSVAVVDFRFANPADYTFVVRKVDVLLEDKDGKVQEGTAISEVDAKNLFHYYPLLGEKYNDSLLMRARIAPHQSMDRMAAVRFEVPEEQLQARKKLAVRIEDVDGAVSELAEKP
jgi:hypothetical protein